MTGIASLLVLLAAAFLQGALPAVAWLGLAKPPLILGAVLYYALAHGRFTMLFAALAGGVIHDSLGFLPLGCTAACFCAVGLTVQTLRGLVFRDSAVTGIALTAVGAVVMTGMTGLFLRLGDGPAVAVGAPASLVAAKAAGTALLAVPAAPLMFVAARALDRVIGVAEGSGA